jgi:hypothetical protein
VSKRSPATAEKAARALAMRLAGATYQEIAEQLGYVSRTCAHRLLRQAIGCRAPNAYRVPQGSARLAVGHTCA